MTDDIEKVSAEAFSQATEVFQKELEEKDKIIARLKKAAQLRRKKQLEQASMASRRKRVLGKK
jgi:hypothetical protein